MKKTKDRSAEVQELVWLLLDEQATESEVRRLEELLLGDPESQATYVTCVQMHADLHYLFGANQPRLPRAIEKLCQQRTADRTYARPPPRLPVAASDVPLSRGATS